MSEVSEVEREYSYATGFFYTHRGYLARAVAKSIDGRVTSTTTSICDQLTTNYNIYFDDLPIHIYDALMRRFVGAEARRPYKLGVCASVHKERKDDN